MVVGLNPTTLAEAGPIAADAVDLSWVDDRLRVVNLVNKYRNLIYTEYDKHKLFDNVFHHICVSDFAQGGVPYKGFTLPSDVLGVESIYACGFPLTLHSRWRESHTGLGVNTSVIVEAVEMAETFATERDLQLCTRIKVYAESELDTGKKVYVEAINSANKLVKICFTLVGEGFAVSSIKVKKIVSVSLPPQRGGSVRLSQSDNYDLSIYAPWETVPVYRRYKVSDSSSTKTVLVQGTKRYVPIYFDHDIVEVGNQLTIEEGVQFFKYSKGSKDQAELKTAEYHYAKFNDYIKGDIARNRGNAIQDGNPFRGPSRKLIRDVKRLPGYR